MFSLGFIKIASQIATKKNQKLWDKIVASVKSSDKGGRSGQWSARKAQIATQKYKDQGGQYEGKKSSNNSLVKWTKEKWQPNPHAKRPDPKKAQDSKGRMTRYLPEKAWQKLTPQEAKATDKKKVSAKSQFVSNTLKAKSAGKEARNK